MSPDFPKPSGCRHSEGEISVRFIFSDNLFSDVYPIKGANYSFASRWCNTWHTLEGVQKTLVMSFDDLLRRPMRGSCESLPVEWYSNFDNTHPCKHESFPFTVSVTTSTFLLIVCTCCSSLAETQWVTPKFLHKQYYIHSLSLTFLQFSSANSAPIPRAGVSQSEVAIRSRGLAGQSALRTQ